MKKAALFLLAALLLASCCGPKGMVSVTVPEASTEGAATDVDVQPDSLAAPCDSLLEALRVIKLVQGIADRDTIRDTVIVEAKAKARRAVAAIRETVCEWEPIDINTDRIKGRIWPDADGSPLFEITCKEVKTDPVPCRCPSQMPWWGWLIILLLALALTAIAWKK